MRGRIKQNAMICLAKISLPEQLFLHVQLVRDMLEQLMLLHGGSLSTETCTLKKYRQQVLYTVQPHMGLTL